MSRVLNSRPECAGPLFEALRPLKSSILSHSLARLHKIVEDQDFSTTQNWMFADVVGLLKASSLRLHQCLCHFQLISAVEDEVKRLEWDNELREETQKNIQKCLSMVAKRLESELKLAPENLLLGEPLFLFQCLS